MNVCTIEMIQYDFYVLFKAHRDHTSKFSVRAGVSPLLCSTVCREAAASKQGKAAEVIS